ncbi:MAG: hypothetical protein FWE80_05870 [Oscillospiraceae bacterium]|nr:hypothetical protein [Oscillospiraceae bacterium]
MLNFYSLPEFVRISFSVLTVICAGFAALAFVLHLYRFKRSRGYWLNGALAFASLCQTVLNAALIAQVQHNIAGGYIVPTGYIVSRCAVFAALSAGFILSLTKKKMVVSGLAFIASFLTLPAMESWTGRGFPVCFSAALLILLIGGVWLSVKIRRELITSISSLSVKQAMDSLDTAVLFYRENGHILMQNSQMQELMIKTAGRVLYNGKLYLASVVIPNSEQIAGGSYLYQMQADDSSANYVWQFTVKEITLGKMPVTQITAADVTEQNRINLLLRGSNSALNAQQEQLKELIENIEKIRYSEELLRVKTKLHDAQNQKLTALLRYLRQGQWPAADILTAAGTSLVYSTREEETVPADPWMELTALTGGYGQAGVKIILDGDLPADREISRALVSILREAAANAVIHGHADEVIVKITTENDTVGMCITDNAALPPKKIREGSGITYMRRCLAALGGTLEIAAAPRFTLLVTIRQKEGE